MRKTVARLQFPARPREVTEGYIPEEVLNVRVENVRDYGSQAQTLYENDRSRFRLMELDVTGTPNYPARTFDEMIVTSVSESLKDRVQFMSSSDTSKLFAFGEEHRVVMIEFTLVDTHTGTTNNPEVADSYRIWTGSTLKPWSDFYEQARISECAKNNQLVEFRYCGSLIYGGLLSESRTINSQMPNQIRVSVSMLVSRAF